MLPSPRTNTLDTLELYDSTQRQTEFLPLTDRRPGLAKALGHKTDSRHDLIFSACAIRKFNLAPGAYVLPSKPVRVKMASRNSEALRVLAALYQRTLVIATNRAVVSIYTYRLI